MIDRADRPLGAVRLAAMLNGEGERLKQPAVFRALQELFVAGKLKRVELASGYLPPGDEAAGVALCRRCGAYAALEGAIDASELRAIARRRDFSATRLVIEVEGLCETCSAAGEE
ncbi:hypothetical protein [uncultured Sphingomonas sp.]|uniref:hypothetical protein n=1 Tax=uncultured Sphingomonas sp. TaxID=158754 RepID=UPI0035C99871